MRYNSCEHFQTCQDHLTKFHPRGCEVFQIFVVHTCLFIPWQLHMCAGWKIKLKIKLKWWGARNSKNGVLTQNYTLLLWVCKFNWKPIITPYEINNCDGHWNTLRVCAIPCMVDFLSSSIPTLNRLPALVPTMLRWWASWSQVQEYRFADSVTLWNIWSALQLMHLLLSWNKSPHSMHPKAARLMSPEALLYCFPLPLQPPAAILDGNPCNILV